MRATLGNFGRVTLRLTLLAATAWALAATSQIQRACRRWPVAFRAEPGCGPGGLVVLESNGGNIRIHNSGALGLPALVGPPGACASFSGGFSLEVPACALPDAGRDAPRDTLRDVASDPHEGDGTADADSDADGDATPQVEPPADGGSGARDARGSDPDAGCMLGTPKKCYAVLEGGELWLTCTEPEGQTCRSRLTEVLP